MTIEDIILDNDRRGISHLRPYVPADFCDRAAQLILDNPGTAFIVTGFYILDAGLIETDGPPGAIAIGNALEQLDYNVVYVTDSYGTAVMEATRSEAATVIDFPIADDAESEAFAQQLLADHQSLSHHRHRAVRLHRRPQVPQHARTRHHPVHRPHRLPVQAPPMHSRHRRRRQRNRLGQRRPRSYDSRIPRQGTLRNRSLRTHPRQRLQLGRLRPRRIPLQALRQEPAPLGRRRHGIPSARRLTPAPWTA